MAMSVGVGGSDLASPHADCADGQGACDERVGVVARCLLLVYRGRRVDGLERVCSSCAVRQEGWVPCIRGFWGSESSYAVVRM
jgi:hypothetical protein